LQKIRFTPAIRFSTEPKNVFLDDSLNTDNNFSSEEIEANNLASEILISPEYIIELPNLRTKDAVKKFSSDIGIHPGIVVGRMQYEGLIKQSWMNDLKEHLN